MLRMWKAKATKTAKTKKALTDRLANDRRPGTPNLGGKNWGPGFGLFPKRLEHRSFIEMSSPLVNDYNPTESIVVYALS